METAYWNPRVRTGPDGTVRVTVRAPTALSRYQFTARGVTGAETLAGQATAELAVRKGFFVDLRRPATLTEGDRPRFLARLLHRGVAGPATVRLTVYAGGRTQVLQEAIELNGDGVAEVLFEPVEVPAGDIARLTLAAQAGEATDALEAEVPIVPWGVPAIASASGTSRDDATVLVGLPPGRAYEDPEMLIVLAPTPRRMLVELALGRGDAAWFDRRVAGFVPTAPAHATADRASELLAACAALANARAAREGEASEAARLTGRIQGLVAELIGLQNDDGGWPWVAGRDARPGSERLTSARVVWALTAAEPLGLLTDPKVLETAVTFLTQEFARVDAADHEARAALLHALGLRGQARFDWVNALNRARPDLTDAALAYLALTLARLDRSALADEVLGVLVARGRDEPAGPGRPPLRQWGDRPGSRHGVVEATALTALALAAARPQAPELAEAIAWLDAHRTGTGWEPPAARGPALAALAAFYGGVQAAEDRYRLVVTVNDAEVYRGEVAGVAEGHAVLVPRKVLRPGGTNRVHFDIEGRGTFGYAVTLTGFTRDFAPDQDPRGRPFAITRRAYLATDPEFDGRILPVGFAVAPGTPEFENPATQVAAGGRVRVEIRTRRDRPAGEPAWRREALILQEHLPAGTSLVEGSVRTQGSFHELADGVLSFYFAPDQDPGTIRYDVTGTLPGSYRARPPRLFDASDPGRSHLGPVGAVTVLAPGEPATDPYRPTPDELFARGRALFDAGRRAEAGIALEDLFDHFTLRDDVLREVARTLLYVHLDPYQPRKIVRDFEVIREKQPDLFLPFEKLLVIGRAYADIGEHERAYLGWVAATEASYLEDARLGAVLRERGRTLQGAAFLLDLGRAYPDTATIQADLVALAQLLARQADPDPAAPDARPRRELAEAGLTRSDLLAQAIRLLRTFLMRAPTSPLADEASLALVGDVLALGDYPTAADLAGHLARLYPRSPLLDGFRYSEALALFHQGRHDRAIAAAEAIV
ncbi:MAG TPA: alpha-2-macroglobulin family protein, partial [Isosphaeraceae bacterium]